MSPETDCHFGVALNKRSRGASKGYVQWRIEGKQLLAHRVVYELFNGAIPKGMLVDHKCGTRACINPAHLRLATKQQNAWNMKKAKRVYKRNDCDSPSYYVRIVRPDATTMHAGGFKTEEEANLFACAVLEKERGEFA